MPPPVCSIFVSCILKAISSSPIYWSGIPDMCRRARIKAGNFSTRDLRSAVCRLLYNPR